MREAPLTGRFAVIHPDGGREGNGSPTNWVVCDAFGMSAARYSIYGQGHISELSGLCEDLFPSL